MKKKIEDTLFMKDIPKRLLLPETAMIAKIESELLNGAVEYCKENNYQLILIPHLTKATGSCENFLTLMTTNIFNEVAYLNQTGQLMLEAFMSYYPKTYCFGPSFRKEKDADSRHLMEFYLFEIEVRDMNLNDLQKEISNIFKNMIENVEKKATKELECLIGESNLDSIKPPYNSITYTDALKILPDKLKWGDDLKSNHEKYLVEWNNNSPLFITHYPKEIKFFNMRLNRENNSIVNSMDLLMPYSGEAVGAAEREEDYNLLIKRLLDSDMFKLLKEAILLENNYSGLGEKELHDEALRRFEWYVDIIREKPIKHSGCGIGLSRVTQSILKTNDIRYATAFPMNRETLF